MKIARYFYLIFIIAMYVFNYFYLKINIFAFTGIVLASLIGVIILINIYAKLKNKGEALHSDDFIFTPEVANTLKKVDISIQYESSMIASFFLIVGLLLFCIYVIFLTQYQTVMKVFIVFNSFFAMILMGSTLITSYQQFISYKESIKIFTQFTDNVGTEVISNKTMFDVNKEEFLDFTKDNNESKTDKQLERGDDD